MKDKALIFLSLVISMAALCYAAWLHQHSAQLAEQAVQKREQQFVQRFAPKVQQVYLGLGVTNVVADAKTLDELFGPYLETLNRMVTPPAEDEKKTP
jgi:hypothetical protein